MQNYRKMLRENPSYARLWLAQAVSLLGDWFSIIALTTLVSYYTDGSGIAISLLLVTHFLPPLIFGPFGGVLVDRMNRKRLLMISDIARTFIVLGFLLATDPSRLWLIYVLSFAQFSLSSIFDPARSAILPSLVKPEDLVRANLLGSVTWSVMLAAGAAIGGVVGTLFGTTIALCIDSSSFAISAMLIASIQWKPIIQQITTIEKTPRTKKDKKDEQMGFVDGLRYIAQHPATAACLLIKMGGSVGSVDAIMVIYATQYFPLGEKGSGSLGLLYAAFGLGAIIGPAVLQRINNGTVQAMRRLILIGYALISVGWFLLSGAPILLLAAGALIVKAMGSSIYWTYSSVIIQKVTPDKFLGRLFSLDMAAFQLMTVTSILITGWLIDRVGAAGVRNLVLWTGLASLIPLILWAAALPWIERQDKNVTVAEIAGD